MTSQKTKQQKTWGTDTGYDRAVVAVVEIRSVYLRAFETGSQARDGIGKWLAYYNAERPHSTHGILTPEEVHASKTEPMKMAA